MAYKAKTVITVLFCILGIIVISGLLRDLGLSKEGVSLFATSLVCLMIITGCCMFCSWAKQKEVENLAQNATTGEVLEVRDPISEL